MPELPALPAGLIARPIDLLDIDAVVDLLTAAEPLDRTGEHWDAEDLAGEWDNDLVDLRTDGLLVSDGDRVVGWATAIAPPTFRDAFTVHLDGRVHPDRRGEGIGRALLDWQLARGAEVHGAEHPEVPARLSVAVPASMDGLERLVRRAGLTPGRVHLYMERPLAGVPEPVAPAGVELVGYLWDRDDEVRRAHNVAFVDHHGSSERDAASWEVMYTGRAAFRPDLSALVLEDGAVVAYSLAYVFESDTRATGKRCVYLGQVGALPGHRGRGLASAAIATSLRTAADRDCDLAGLQVDSENGSGAVGLYERLGFGVIRRTTSWTRALPALARR